MDAAPAVSCTSCKRVWRSATMAEGLRLVGACPRCGGELEFHDEEQAQEEARQSHADERISDAPPHRVLGLPRR